VCDSTPLKSLVSYCSSVLAFVENVQAKGDVTVSSAKNKSSGKAKADLSSASTSVSDVDLSVFSGRNVQEVVKLLKSAIEPLQQVIAEAEELDTPSAKSASSQQKYETVAAKLKAEYVKSACALSAVKRTKLPDNIGNCTVAIERINPSISEETHVSRSRRNAGNSVADAEDCGSVSVCNSVNSSNRASRADIEAQRELHQQMLSSKDDSSNDDTESSSESSTSEDAESSSSDDDDDDDDDDEYDPKSDIRQVKLEQGRERRTTTKKLKMRAGNLYALDYSIMCTLN